MPSIFAFCRSRMASPLFMFAVLAVLSLVLLISPGSNSHSFAHTRQPRRLRFDARQGVESLSSSILSSLSTSTTDPVSSTSAVLESASVTSSSVFNSAPSSFASSKSAVSSSSASGTSSAVSSSSSSIFQSSTQSSTRSPSSTFSPTFPSKTSTIIFPTPTTQASRSTEPSDAIPRTTLVITGDVTPPSSSVARTITYDLSQTVETTTSLPVAAAGNGFWDNKGAVAGTFTVVGLIILVGVVILVVTLMKRQNARRQARLHRSLFETYPEPELTHSRSESLGPSINADPMNAFETREVQNTQSMSQYARYAANDPYQSTPQADQSLGGSYAPSHQHSIPRRTAAAAPPVAYREPAGRDSAYQPSIDSFYGAASQPAGPSP